MAKSDVYFDRQTQEFVGLDERSLELLTDAYHGVDVITELKKMKIWLTNAAKGKRVRGRIQFITNWLSRAKPKDKETSFIDPDTALEKLYNHYVQELWRNREFLLELNTKH